MTGNGHELDTFGDQADFENAYAEKTEPGPVFDVRQMQEKKAASAAGSTSLIVLAHDSVLTYPLPGQCSVIIGRSVKADVCVDDPSISRAHAQLTIAPPSPSGESGLLVRDLRSSNGTRLRGQTIPPEQDVPFEPGDLIDIGQTTFVLKRGKPTGRLRRLCTHGYFELRLEDECERSKNRDRSFAVLRIRVMGESSSAIEEALTAFLGPQDSIALYAPSEYEILLIESSRQEAEQAAAGIRFGLSRLGASVQVGLACFPQDGQDPEVLAACAGATVRGRPRGDLISGEQSLIIDDLAMRQLYQLAERVAISDISVLVLGETGVGKEVLAKAIHAHSRRANKPFLPINCGAVPAELLESELFGYEKGAFTGAIKFKPGLFETASGGTLFLDEIGEMPLETQVKLLRVIEERRFRRVGGLETHALDVRFIAATNRDLEKELAAGTFREDLYYRLHGISLVIPPLRERTGDIPLFAKSFAAECRAREGRNGAAAFTREAMQLLCKYAWPGNVRELKNIIERAVVLAGNDPIGPEHLPLEKLSAPMILPPEAPLRSRLEPAPLPTTPTKLTPKPREDTLRTRLPGAETLTDQPLDDLLQQATLEKAQAAARSSLASELEEFERCRILDVLQECGGNQTRAAERLGISRKALITRIDRYGITRPRKR
jgi:two-component system, NtrC family, response regulator AtoC